MKLETAIQILEYHQQWRLGKKDDMKFEPKEITQALNVVIGAIKKIKK